MRRLLALVLLVVLAAIAFYYWRGRPPQLEGARQAVASVGNKLQATKTVSAVKAALELDRDLGRSPIDVDAGQTEGVVVLRGEVPSDEAKADAAHVAAAVPGVEQVVNELRVNPALPEKSDAGRTLGENLDDRALEAKVRMAFSLDRQLKGTDIDVSAYRRHVTLRGWVDTPAQRQLAVDIAGRTRDVAGVTDEIAVRGQATPGSPAASPTISSPAPTAPPRAVSPSPRTPGGRRPEGGRSGQARTLRRPTLFLHFEL